MGECCDMKGFLSFLILLILSKKDMNGQEIADEMERRKGERPSPGTIYPALKHLNKSGLIHEKKKGKTIIYNLTIQGKKSVNVAKQRFKKTFNDLI